MLFNSSDFNSTEGNMSSIQVVGSKQRVILLVPRVWRCTSPLLVCPFMVERPYPLTGFCQCNCEIVRDFSCPTERHHADVPWQGLDPCRLPDYSITRTHGENTDLSITLGSVGQPSSAYLGDQNSIVRVARTVVTGDEFSCLTCGPALILSLQVRI
jgi:hypothetical protein